MRDYNEQYDAPLNFSFISHNLDLDMNVSEVVEGISDHHILVEEVGTDNQSSVSQNRTNFIFQAHAKKVCHSEPGYFNDFVVSLKQLLQSPLSSDGAMKTYVLLPLQWQRQSRCWKI